MFPVEQYYVVKFEFYPIFPYNSADYYGIEEFQKTQKAPLCRPSNSELSSTMVKLMPSHHPARKCKSNQK